MKQKRNSIKTNLIYGLFIIVPVGMVVVLIVHLVKVLNLLAQKLGLESAVGAGLGVLASILLLLLICYGVGALIHTRLGAFSFSRFEEKLLKPIPGYKMISKVLKGFADKKEAYPPARVKLAHSGVEMLGFVMEENSDETLTVYVPMAPLMMIGNIHIVERERVTLLDSAHTDVFDCISEFGLGSGKILASKHRGSGLTS